MPTNRKATEKANKRDYAMDKNKRDFRRERIVNNGLLSFLDSVNISDRNKEIVRRYTAGESETRLSKCYGVTPNRIASVIACFLWHCSQIKQKGKIPLS